MSRALAALAGCTLALCLPSTPAHAQTTACRVPDRLPAPRAVNPRPGEEKRGVPVAGYTLAMSWSPQYCADRGGGFADMQCSGTVGQFGFILHGLWPEGAGQRWPQYCRPAGLVPREVVRSTLCVMPSVQLMQHEWARHGTCVATRSEDYFAAARRAFQAVRVPDMRALARDPRLTGGKLIAAFTGSNPALRPEMLRVRTQGQWLDELWLCLDRALRPVACPAGKSGLRPGGSLRIRL